MFAPVEALRFDRMMKRAVKQNHFIASSLPFVVAGRQL
jgi:hypothetical protein